MLRKAIQILALTFLLTIVFYSQEDAELYGFEDTKIPIKVDEFGLIGGCDLNARVQNFFVELNNKPTAEGYIVLYQAKNTLPANRDSNPLEKRIRREIHFLRLDASRIVFVNGGFRDELVTELYVVPSGANPPEPTGTMPAPTTPEDATFLYDKNFVNDILYGDDGDDYYDVLDEFILPSVVAKMAEEARLAEEQARAEEANQAETSQEDPNEAQAETVEENFEGEETVEKKKITTEEIEEAKFSWVNEKFGEIIRKQNKSRGVIIFYADETYYDVGKLQNLFQEGKQKIARANKISIDKIQVVYGGYRETVQAEFWIIPEKGESPTPVPEEKVVEKTIETEETEN